MKLKKVTHNPRPKPFVKTKELEIYTIAEKGKITKFICVYKGDRKEFPVPVKTQDILKAWKQMENWLDKKK